MLKEVLPTELYNLLYKYVNFSKLYEIRIRFNYPIILNISNTIYSINTNGLCEFQKGLKCSNELIEKIVYISTQNSFYASKEQIVSGFISSKNGIRIGIVGECIYDNGKIVNLVNISSLNIRMPHAIENCSKDVIPYIVERNNIINNTLIISPPGAGKTTMLRDIIKQLSNIKRYLNLLVIDERYEIAGFKQKQNIFNLGYNVDILSGCNKTYGLTCGIRSMSPNVIFTDEIATEEDAKGVVYASTCGVNVVATMHAKNMEDCFLKKDLELIFKNKIFTRYIVLSFRNGAGTIEGVYNRDFNLLYRE